jgi:hypothetical protein
VKHCSVICIARCRPAHTVSKNKSGMQFMMRVHREMLSVPRAQWVLLLWTWHAAKHSLLLFNIKRTYGTPHWRNMPKIFFQNRDHYSHSANTKKVVFRYESMLQASLRNAHRYGRVLACTKIQSYPHLVIVCQHMLPKTRTQMWTIHELQSVSLYATKRQVFQVSWCTSSIKKRYQA